MRAEHQGDYIHPFYERVRRWGMTWDDHVQRQIRALVIAPGAAWIAVAGGGQIRIIDRSGRLLTWLLPGALISNALAIDPSASLLAHAGEHITVYSTATWKRIFEASDGSTSGGQAFPHVAVHPKGTLVAAARFGGGITVWDFRRKRIVYDHDGGYCWRVAFSNDGRWLAYTSEPGIEVRNVTDWSAPASIEFPSSARAWTLTFTHDGARLIAGVGDELEGDSLIAWTTHDWRIAETIPLRVRVAALGGTEMRSLVVSDGGQRLVTEPPSPVHLLDARSLTEICEPFDQDAEILGIAPYGDLVAVSSGDSLFELWRTIDP